jgi:hypothetical protein
MKSMDHLRVGQALPATVFAWRGYERRAVPSLCGTRLRLDTFVFAGRH